MVREKEIEKFYKGRKKEEPHSLGCYQAKTNLRGDILVILFIMAILAVTTLALWIIFKIGERLWGM